MATPFLDFENDVENTLQPGVAFNALADDVDAALAGNVVVDFTDDDDLTLTRPQWMTAVLVLTDTGPVLTGGVDVVFPEAFPGALVVNETAQTLTLTNGGTDEVTLDAGDSVRIAAGPDGVLASSTGGGGGSGVVESVVAGTGISVDNTDPANPVVSATGGGSGDVVGPASATDGAVALFDGTGGKTLKDGVTIATIRSIPQNSQSTAYTAVLSDAGKHLLHPSADTTARTFTIPANSSVAYPVGTALTFVNQNGAGVMTIAITTDTMRLAGTGTTGSRTLAANGIATALKITSTEWIINGTGLT